MNPESITLDLEDLTPPQNILKTTKTKEINKRYSSFKSEFICSSYGKDDELVEFGNHSVLQGFVCAYIEHRPITISPDIIWLLIVQGFSYHVEFNAEKLRSKFVNFKNRKKLAVDVNMFNFRDKNQWEDIFPQFVNKIQSYTGEKLMNTLTPDFTTTTKTSLAVGQISIMAAMKQYFKYRLSAAGCGLPSVTIEGSKEDWIKIQERVSFLEQFELKWWTSKLQPIIQEIIHTKDGNVNKNFWLRMIRYKDSDAAYEPSIIDGWFVTFFPYDAVGHKMSLDYINDDDEMPKEMLKVPFELKLFIPRLMREYFDCEMYGGFIGLRQDPETFNLKPEIGWVIAQNKEKRKNSLMFCFTNMKNQLSNPTQGHSRPNHTTTTKPNPNKVQRVFGNPRKIQASSTNRKYIAQKMIIKPNVKPK
ncbi:uncharacterized protein TRFO_13310 [Tritrichomonas foetus]|uniref:Uncharacterized protein n=1 Tax=Tritrichomonas foetus TaxID=1144522 RepID=A0A1J4KYR4_9EUKA|nr:uncharacterized protein TRFO_13310 [Tritrichomonas foetus]|eukprot:OHT16298.1 uncharacterized protein TRFO_13310 [Tritrichomonas foetus]